MGNKNNNNLPGLRTGAGKLPNDAQEIDLLELFGFYMTKIVWIIIAFIIGGGLAFLYTWKMVTPMYTATSKVYMVSASSESAINLSDLNLGTSLSEDYIEMLKIRPIYEAVIDELELDYDYEQLLKMVHIGKIGNTRLITINVESAIPLEAANISNALAQEAVETLPVLMDTNEPHIAETAIIPTKKSSPSFSKNIMMGALIFALLVIAILTVQFLLDDTFKTSDDIEKEFGVMPLTVIPEVKMEGMSEADEKRSIREFRRRKHNDK